MEKEIAKILRRISTSKWIILAFISGIIAIFVWINFDFLTEVSFTLRKDAQTPTAEEKSDDDKPNTARLVLGDIILPPNPERLPSIVVFEIKNPSGDSASNVRISIDYGASKVIAYEILGPSTDEVMVSESGRSILNIDIAQVRPHESAYIYAQTSIPTFRKITVSSETTSSVIDYTIKDHNDKVQPNNKPIKFQEFLWFLFGGFIVVMSVFFTYVLIQKISDWLNVRGL